MSGRRAGAADWAEAAATEESGRARQWLHGAHASRALPLKGTLGERACRSGQSRHFLAGIIVGSGGRTQYVYALYRRHSHFSPLDSPRSYAP